MRGFVSDTPTILQRHKCALCKLGLYTDSSRSKCEYVIVHREKFHRKSVLLAPRGKNPRPRRAGTMQVGRRGVAQTMSTGDSAKGNIGMGSSLEGSSDKLGSGALTLCTGSKLGSAVLLTF
jgi:hypothetical protein